MGSLFRSVGVLILVAVAACGDDGVHHLADAPGLPDVPADMPGDVPTDAAVDAPPNIDLTVMLAGNGGGTVTSSVGGIDCGATCADDYPPNTTVTLTAEPAVGSLFTGWMGGCTGTSPTCDVTLAQATTVTATFTLQTFTVTVGKVGVGTGTVMGSGINCGSTCTTTVNYGTAITLTAAPLSLSNFIGWGGPCTGTGMCTTTITANTAITAAFALDDISMTVTKSGNGSGTVTSAPAGINCGADCDQIYVANTVVTLTAAPATGSTFTGWSGAGCTGTGACVVTMTAAVLVTATFTLDTFQVDIVKAGNGTGTVTSAPAGIACGGDCDETYDYNTMVTLTAAAGAGSTFTGWSGGGGCTGTGTCVVTVTAATSVTATFTLNMYLLSVARAGTGSGSVSSTPAGITCGADCNQLYNHGTMVSLSAAPAAGSTFTGWSGACTGTGACMVTMTAAASVTATFTINSYALTMALAGNGAGSVASSPAGITCGADCTEAYTHGTVVTLTPTAMVGSTFTGWSGACTGTGACAVTMTAASAVTATFTLNTFALTVAKAGNGSGTVTSTPVGISCGADCSETYNFGQMVMLANAATTGSTFTGWSGACTGTGACIVTMDAAKSVTATFTLDSLTLTVARAGTGSGSVTSTPAGITCGADCTEIYNFGTMVTLAQSATTGSTFTGWSGACTGTGACVVTMDAAKSVTATFTLNTYLLTAAKAGTGAGTVTSTPAGINCGIDCTETYGHGTMVTLAQAATTGSTFTGWSGACTGTGACVVTMDAAKSVTATFALNTYTLSVAKAGTGSGTVSSTPAGINCGVDCNEVYSHGMVIVLSQTPTTGSTFAGWSGDCTGTGTCTVTMSAARSVTATYTLNTYTLTAIAVGNGTITSSPAGISCGADCNEVYNHGTVVTLSQSAGTGSTFTGWTGGCTGTGACSVTMDMARSVTATFTLNTYTLSVTKPGTGSGTVTSSPAGINCGADCNEVYGHGTVVMLSQTPTTGSTFAGWGGGVCSGTGACMVTMDMARSVTATFTLNTYTLTVSKLGTGAGTVTSMPAGISCGATCSQVYGHGTVVMLSQTPTTGSTFAGWGGGVCSGTGACMVTMDMARTVTATFTLNTYTLTANKAGAGAGTVTSTPAGISCGADCTEVYGHGTAVTLSQSATLGSVFGGWSGACSGMGACTVTMDMAKSVTATFNIATYTLTVTNASSAGGAGTISSSAAGISCGADCSEVYNYGTVVTLNATPATASNFIGWSACGGLGSCTITITGPTSVTGTFSAPNVMFVISKPYRGAFGAGTPNGPDAYADGECQAAAQAANLVGTGPGRNLTFRAWLSSNATIQGGTINAKNKFDGSNGWARTGDWKPVMNTVGDFASSKIWYPPRRDETGAEIGTDVLMWTGTDLNGNYSGVACNQGDSWSSASGTVLGTVGLSSATGSPITQFSDTPCSTLNRRFLCMGLGRDTSVGAPPAGGKLAFTTEGTWTPNPTNGINGADSLCTAEAGAANLPGTYKALLTPLGATAIGRFNMTGRPWVRVGDLQPITTLESTMYSTTTTVLDVAPNASANGGRIGHVSIYTGAATITSVGGASGTCGDWTNPGEFKGSAGFPFDTGMQKYFFGAQNNNVPCSVARHVVCLQQ